LVGVGEGVGAWAMRELRESREHPRVAARATRTTTVTKTDLLDTKDPSL
jgi:hypothetical protein